MERKRMSIVCDKGRKVGGKRETKRQAVLEKKRKICERKKRDGKGNI
jgi:hypothetical protein